MFKVSTLSSITFSIFSHIITEFKISTLVFCTTFFLLWNLVSPKSALAFHHGSYCTIGGSTSWYIAFGKTVFDFQPATFKRNFEANVEDAPLDNRQVPSKTSVPLGCYGNPEQLQSLIVYFWPPLTQMSRDDASPSKIIELEMYRRFDGPNTLKNPDSPTSISYSNTVSCKFYKFRIKQTDGSVFCVNLATLDLQRIPIDPTINWMFISSVDDYVTYDNEPLTVDWNNFEKVASVKYVFNQNILLRYKWYVAPKIRDFGSNYLINLDQSIQKQLRKRLITNYQWPR